MAIIINAYPLKHKTFVCSVFSVPSVIQTETHAKNYIHPTISG